MARRTWWKVGALLVAMMVFLTMLPATALAAEGDTVYVGGVALTGSTDSPVYAKTDDSGNVSQDGATAANYNIMWDGNTLTLKGAYITGQVNSGNISGAAIGVENSSGDTVLNIQLENSNTVSASTGIHVHSSGGKASLTITGSGSLNASGTSNEGIGVQSNSGNATLTIQDAEIIASASSYDDGVQVQAGANSDASLTVDGGSLTATGKGDYNAGIRYAFGGSGSGCGTPSLTVSGNAMVKASGRAGGITSYSSPVTPSGAGIVFNNGTGTVYGNVELQKDLEIGEDESLMLDDGASLGAGGHKVIVDGGTLDDSIKNSLGDSVKYPPTITTASLPNGEVGTIYKQTLEATGSDTITWSVSGSLPAGLSLSGSFISGTPTAADTSTFTVTAENSYGSNSKEFSITISAPALVSVTGVSLNKGRLNLYVGGNETLTATVQPTNATNKGVTWSSDNESVVTVNRGVVTAVSAGTATITVTTEDGNKTATCAVTVAAATVPVTGVTLSQNQAHLYYNGAPNTLALTATVAPDNATDKAVTWTSSNSSVATVDGSGNVTAVVPGTAAITVTTSDGDKTATCLVTVTGVYIPPRPTGPDWGDVADDIADAEPGSTVKVDMDGKAVLPGEVLDELAGRDVTLALDMGDGLFWEIYGGDVPADAGHEDVDLGVALGGDSIPADVANLVTGESGSVQVSLEHDGPFGFELTLVAPLGEDAEGLVANLYRYDDEAGSLGYEASAQVDGEGVARLPFDHASSWLFALDSRTHALPFSDANDGEWYSEAVRWAWLGGVMTGYGDGSGLFGTSSALTRAEAAVVLWRLAGEPEGVSGLPADCDPSGFYAEAASWALGAGVFSGYSGDAFGPADTITREQLATVLWRAAGSPEVGGDLSSFSDAADVSGFADVAMRWAVSAGVLRGQGDGDALDPQGACTRAQLATMLHRLAAAE
ncbi:Ig-like domain-containing protein [Thermophilibacter mediterraneus]|uniref:Ig-like domain-containing protein n=1 Tax=Thermophilibacter mediterraneus TaxID=1871031 RepID=UPI00320AF58F